MDLGTLVERTLININEDLDEQTVAEYRPRIVQLINEAYMEICAQRAKPKKTAMVAVEDGLVLTESLPEGYIKAVGMQTVDGKPLHFETQNGKIRVFGFTGTAQMECMFRPDPLMLDEDLPIIADWAHYALSDYATWRLMSTGSRARQVRGEVFWSQYLHTCLRLDGVQDASLRILNKY